MFNEGFHQVDCMYWMSPSMSNSGSIMAKFAKIKEIPLKITQRKRKNWHAVYLEKSLTEHYILAFSI